MSPTVTGDTSVCSLVTCSSTQTCLVAINGIPECKLKADVSTEIQKIAQVFPLKQSENQRPYTIQH